MQPQTHVERNALGAMFAWALFMLLTFWTPLAMLIYIEWLR